MDQSTFTQLTGITLSSSQAARLSSVAELAGDQLGELLGWPLDPDSWDNQYIEIGKTRDEWDCPDVDASELDDPDEVVGKYRLYRWSPVEPYIFIDPATTVNAVKLVKNGVTYKTFSASEYSLDMQNGAPAFARYIHVGDNCTDWILRHWPWNWPYEPRGGTNNVQVAVDAEWAFTDLPTSLQKLQADMCYYELDTKRDIKSESMTSHSYSRNAHPDPTVTTSGAAVLAKYVGPNGTAVRPGVIV